MAPLRSPAGLVLPLCLLALLASCSGGDGPRPQESPTPAPSPTGHPPGATATPGAEATYIPVDGIPRATFYGAEDGDSVSGLATGDFNGDGAMDLLLASPVAAGPENDRPQAGEALVFLGPFSRGDVRDAGAGQQDLTLYGADPGDQMGRAVAAADLNGDGADDIVLGAPFADGPQEGRQDSGETYIVFGSPQLTERTDRLDFAQSPPDATVFGADAKDLSGFSLATAAIAGDGATDLIVGALWGDGPDNARTDAGDAYVLAGRPQFPARLDLRDGPEDAVVWGAEPRDRLSESMTVADVNGDGSPDLIVAAAFAAGPDNARDAVGETYVIFGPLPAAVDIARAQQDVTIIGVDPGDQLGHALASGDTNGDGYGDILLAAVSSDGYQNAEELAGEATLVLGGAQMPAVVQVTADGPGLLVYGADNVDRLGRADATGDVDGDGLADLLLAAPGGDGSREASTNAGEVYLIAGSAHLEGHVTAAQLTSVTIIEGEDRDDLIGAEVFGKPSLLVHDMNGDGHGEILLSASDGDGPDDSRPNAGEAYILFLEPRP